jgi:endonuclease/exonuclease/phosphatase family metal-dependent hydrolase
MKQLVGWANTFSQQRILAGDFNAWPGAGEIDYMTSGHFDAWANAISKGVDVAYSGNSAGNTRNSRIDYIFYSRQVSRISLVKMQVFDTRDSGGDMPSDHRPIMATYEVK